MPIGILTNAAAILAGGLLGSAVGKKIPARIKDALMIVFPFCSITIGITQVVKMHALSVIVLAMILGTILGEALQLETLVDRAFSQLIRRCFSSVRLDEDYMVQFITIVVLFCASGTGIYGSLNEGLTHDSSIMITKSILDFFTAIIFAAVLGKTVSIIAAPQCVIFLLLFFSARLILPLTTDSMIADFSAVGGVITIAAGFRMAKLMPIRLVNFLPAMVLVFPLSWIWNAWIG